MFRFPFVANLKLRTPLNPILGWSQLLTSGRLNPEQTAKGITIIQRNAKLQAQLIEDLLDVSRILRGKIELNKVPLNLADTIDSAIALSAYAGESDRQQASDAGFQQHIVKPFEIDNFIFTAIKLLKH